MNTRCKFAIWILLNFPFFLFYPNIPTLHLKMECFLKSRTLVCLCVLHTVWQGNAATKKLNETDLVDGTLHRDDCSKAIEKSFVSKPAGQQTDQGGRRGVVTKIKNKGKTWVMYEESRGSKNTNKNETLLWTAKSKGMIKKRSIIDDRNQNRVATIIIAKKGMMHCTNWLCRPVPAFEGQEKVTDEMLQQIGIDSTKDPQEVPLYPFAKLVTNRTMTTGKCNYGIVTGKKNPDTTTHGIDNDDEDHGLIIEPLYEGEKFPAMGIKAIFQQVTSTGTTVPVAKG